MKKETGPRFELFRNSSCAFSEEQICPAMERKKGARKEIGDAGGLFRELIGERTER